MSIIGKFAIVIAASVLVAVLCGYPTKWLVNYLFTPHAITLVFGTPSLSFWQALGLNVLCEFLFKATTSTGGKA